MASKPFEHLEHEEFSRFVKAHEQILDEAVEEGYKKYRAATKSGLGIITIL